MERICLYLYFSLSGEAIRVRIRICEFTSAFLYENKHKLYTLFLLVTSREMLKMEKEKKFQKKGSTGN